MTTPAQITAGAIAGNVTDEKAREIIEGYLASLGQWPAREEGVDEILQPYGAYISARPRLTSLLYDINMLPEQTVTKAGAIRLAGLCEVWKLGEEGKLTTPTPAGDVTEWVTVPRKPTEWMLDCGACYEDPDGHYKGHPIWEEGDLSRDVWRAMIEAAPPMSAEPALWQCWSDTFGWVELMPDQDRSLYKVRPLFAHPAIAEVAVKPLEWKIGDWEYTAETPFGKYVMRENRDRWIMTGLMGGTFDSIDVAQSTAQADYESRIRSALAHPDTKVIAKLANEINTLRRALEKIASPSQTDSLLWWQIEARTALSKDRPDE